MKKTHIKYKWMGTGKYFPLLFVPHKNNKTLIFIDVYLGFYM